MPYYHIGKTFHTVSRLVRPVLRVFNETTYTWNAKKVGTFYNGSPYVVFFRLLAVLPLNPHLEVLNVNQPEEILYRGSIPRKLLRMNLDSQLWAG